MSWSNAIPLWILLAEHEEHLALSLCAFKEELDAGYLRDVPDYVAEIRQKRKILESAKEAARSVL